MSTLADLQRSKSELIAENMFLRQQLNVLERQVVRPKLMPHNRRLLVLLASRVHGWREALVVVKPETLLGRHREGFRLYWKRRSRVRQGRPPTSPEVITLIEEMAIHKPTWRAERIKGELLKLGIVIDKNTVRSTCDERAGACPHAIKRSHGQRFSRIMLERCGPVIFYRRTIYSFEWCLCTSLSSWAYAASCNMG